MTQSVPTTQASGQSATLSPVVVGPDPWQWAPVDPVTPPDVHDPPTAPDLGAITDFAGVWAGTGFNTIFRPNTASPPGGDNVLELNLTAETLSFSAPLGSVPNRGMLQGDIFLNGMPYQQTVSDVTNPGASVGIHVEPGLWMTVPPTTQPNVGQSYARLASIPHGTTLLAQGTAATAAGKPTIPSVDITPTIIGGGKNRFPSQTANQPNAARIPQDLTAWINAGTITQAILDDPNSILRSHIANQNIISTTTIAISGAPNQPLFGGGEENIAFLLGDAAAAHPNAAVTSVTATFWIETLQVAAEDGTATSMKQIQYSQTVILSFNGLLWPHVSVGTLTPVTAAPTALQSVAAAAMSNEYHIVGVASGRLMHTFRNAAGQWQAGFGVIESQEQNDPGAFTAVACAEVDATLHVVGVAGGRLWHTFRNDNGSWQSTFGSVDSQESNNPGPFTSVALAAGANSILELTAVGANGLLWHTIRNANGTWQPAFDPITG